MNDRNPGDSDIRRLLLLHVDYSTWANQRLLAGCSALTPAELNRDLSTSHSSVLGTLRHIYYAERVWLKRLRTNIAPPLVEVGDQQLFQDRPPEPDLAALERSWPAVWTDLHDYCETSPQAELAVELRGSDWGMPRWQVLLHLVNHSTLHRGQAMGMLRQMGIAPPHTDLMNFYRELAAAGQP